MRVAREQDARRELEWLCGRALDWSVLVEEASAAIRRVIPHERFCFHTLDPATLLLTGGMARNLDPTAEGYLGVLRNEYEEDDVNKWAALARSDPPVGSLTTATEGRRERSPRYASLLRPHQLAWELRGSLVSDGLCWGTVGIYRSDGERDFDDDEQRFLAGVAATLARGFRRSLVAGSPPRDDAPDAPGLILFDEQGAAEQISPAAERHLEELPGAEHRPDGFLGVEVHSVAARARGGSGDGEARARVRTVSGRWLSLDGVALDGGRRVAVVIQPAQPREVAPLLFDSYGLTERERVIATLTLRGLSTSEIARTVHISPYTVQDHLKAIFAKVGVRSRRQLVARVFYEHQLPRMAAGTQLGLDGALLPAG